jgi:hypothetical protein
MKMADYVKVLREAMHTAHVQRYEAMVGIGNHRKGRNFRRFSTEPRKQKTNSKEM